VTLRARRSWLPLLLLLAASRPGRAQSQNNPLTPVLNDPQNALSTLGVVYQQSVQPGMLLVRYGGGPQLPNPVPAVATMKVVNETPHMPHTSINVGRSFNFFLSLLGYDPSAKLKKLDQLEVYETEFFTTRIDDDEMEALVYHDHDFAKKVNDIIAAGGVPYLIESVWMATSLHVTHVSNADLGLSTGPNLPGCTAAERPTQQPEGTGSPQSGGTQQATGSGGTQQATGSGGTQQATGRSGTVQLGAGLPQSVRNAITNAVDGVSKQVAQAVASPVQVGFETCLSQNSLLELHSDKPVPMAVKLQHVFLRSGYQQGLDFEGAVNNF
jgi:hypothetical protein